MVAKSEIVKSTDSEIDLSIPLDVDNLSYAELVDAGEFYTLPGFNLTEKDDLLGVPHAIVKVVYQVKGYVSVHAIVAPTDVLEVAKLRGRMVSDKVSAGEKVVYNDGSTGIRRQLTKQLEMYGLLTVGKPPSDGDARFDTPWQEWAEFAQSERLGSKADAPIVPSFTRNHLGNQLVINSGYGLYKSEYVINVGDPKVDGGEAVTYFLR